MQSVETAGKREWSSNQEIVNTWTANFPNDHQHRSQGMHTERAGDEGQKETKKHTIYHVFGHFFSSNETVTLIMSLWIIHRRHNFRATDFLCIFFVVARFVHAFLPQRWLFWVLQRLTLQKDSRNVRTKSVAFHVQPFMDNSLVFFFSVSSRPSTVIVATDARIESNGGNFKQREPYEMNTGGIFGVSIMM